VAEERAVVFQPADGRGLQKPALQTAGDLFCRQDAGSTLFPRMGWRFVIAKKPLHADLWLTL
jgi:hypothetical protein